MGGLLRQLLADAGPVAAWAAFFIAVIIAVFALCVGISMVETLRAANEEQVKIRYRVFRDVLGLFRRKGR